MPYQDRQTFEDEEPFEMGDDAPQRGVSQLVLWVILAALVAGGIGTVFAMMHSP